MSAAGSADGPRPAPAVLPGAAPGGADASALARMLAVSPRLCALERAGALLQLGTRELLHAGPPLQDGALPCLPVQNAAVAALLYEGWAETEAAARDMLAAGAISFSPAQDRDCVVPLADVVSPSMWLQVVRDAAAPQRQASSPLNAGAVHAMRVGVYDDAVVQQLRWLDTVFAPAYRALVGSDPINLIALADQGLAAGDDCHGRTPAATAALAQRLATRGGDPQAQQTCAEFLARSPGFFLNLWMAATRCMLAAAVDTRGASLVTAAGGNGIDFGIQLAGMPGRWFRVEATAPVVPGADAAVAAAALGAIGDSAIVDLLGVGAMATLAVGEGAAPAAPPFAGLWPERMQAPSTLLQERHPAFVRSGARLGISAARVAATGAEPVVSLGVLDRAGQGGRLGGGFYPAPAALFRQALAELRP